MGIEKASGRWEIGKLGFGGYETNDKIVETSHDTSGIAFGHTSSVFS